MSNVAKTRDPQECHALAPTSGLGAPMSAPPPTESSPTATARLPPQTARTDPADAGGHHLPDQRRPPQRTRYSARPITTRRSNRHRVLDRRMRINRGMRLEAIAALLGHRSMEMTLNYARIADRVVADEYASVHAHIDALYGQIPTGALPADVETAAMTRLRHEAHARMLGNGLCTRPAGSTAAWRPSARPAPTSPPDRVRPVLLRQRDHTRTPPDQPRRPLQHPHRKRRNTLLTAITRITLGVRQQPECAVT